jgi:hypothetical protein
MLRLFFKVANDQAITEAEMRALIADVDEKKHKKALDRLAANRTRGH